MKKYLLILAAILLLWGCIAEDSDADLVLLDEGYQIDTMLAKGRIMMQDKQVLVKGTFE